MKKFLLKGLLFLTILCCVCGGILFLSAREPFRAVLAKWSGSEEFMDGNEMLPYFSRAAEQDGTTRLIIGDSICRQLFSGLSDSNPQTSILATNAALMITGQYLLAEEYLQNHPDATDIYLIMHPLTLVRTFDTEWGYRYAAMTYVETDTLGLLDENTIGAMEQVYGAFFLRKEVVELIENSPVCRKLYLSYINLNARDYVQSSYFEIADQYIRKLYERCEEEGVRLHLYSSPVAEYYREEMEELAGEYAGTWMYSRYPGYFDGILYYPSQWSEDLSHFSGEYAERGSLNEIIQDAYGETPLLEGLELE